MPLAWEEMGGTALGWFFCSAHGCFKTSVPPTAMSRGTVTFGIMTVHGREINICSSG